MPTRPDAIFWLRYAVFIATTIVGAIYFGRTTIALKHIVLEHGFDLAYIVSQFRLLIETT